MDLQPFLLGVLLLAALTAAAVHLRRTARNRVMPRERDPVRVADVTRIFQALVRTGNDGGFVVFVFNPADRPAMEDTIEVGFSIDGGRAGFDWLLTGSVAIADRERFAAFAGARGHAVIAREEHEARYLRVEDGDLPALCVAAMAELYGLDEESQLDIILDGFEWEG